MPPNPRPERIAPVSGPREALEVVLRYSHGQIWPEEQPGLECGRVGQLSMVVPRHMAGNWGSTRPLGKGNIDRRELGGARFLQWLSILLI